MIQNPLILSWPDADATSHCAVSLGPALNSGDTILLSGPVGAGKTHFGRALIQSLLDVPEDVPSPTFTLVQTYDTSAGALWHADLYRISNADEIEELGLLDAFDDAICLVEWPDRLGSVAPIDALLIDIAPDQDRRTANLSWSDPKWETRLQAMVQHA